MEARIGWSGVLGQLAHLRRGTPAQHEATLMRGAKLLRDALAEASSHPRLLWAADPTSWVMPKTIGGGPRRAMDAYEECLRVIGAQALPASALVPTWGEVELLMNLAWSHLHLAPPNLTAAFDHAGAALALEPDWHYVRALLLPQIERAAKKDVKD